MNEPGWLSIDEIGKIRVRVELAEVLHHDLELLLGRARRAADDFFGQRCLLVAAERQQSHREQWREEYSISARGHDDRQ